MRVNLFSSISSQWRRWYFFLEWVELEMPLPAYRLSTGRRKGIGQASFQALRQQMFDKVNSALELY